MSRLNNYFFTLLAVLVCVIAAPLLTSCGNNGPINPDYSDVEGVNTDNPPIPPNDNNPPADDDNFPYNRQDYKKITPVTDSGEFSAEVVMELADALEYLEAADGGVTMVSLPADKCVINLWDIETGLNLAGEVLIKCESGPTGQLSVNGLAAFQGVVFPITVTANVPNYALETVVQTNANVLSFAMKPKHVKDPAWIFGVSETLGADEMTFYDDNFIPVIYTQPASQINPAYLQFEIEIVPGERFGFSGFIRGKTEIGGAIPDPPFRFSPIFFMASCLAWDFEPLNEGDKRFYKIQMDSKNAPDGFEQSDISIPSDVWDALVLDEGNNSSVFVLPTAIICDGYRYLAMGAHADVVGDDPAILSANWRWWEPAETEDRAVLAGHLRMPDGSYDIVHMDWHPGGAAPDIDFSGAPLLGVTGGFSDAFTFPVFAFTDPIGADSNFIRVRMSLNGEGQIWNITCGAGLDTLDTADLSVPDSWLDDGLSIGSVLYQAEYIDTLGMDIDGFNERQIVLSRRETCITSWEDEQV